MGSVFHRQLPQALADLAIPLRAQAHVRALQPGIWHSQATVDIQAPWLDEPVTLPISVQHGPLLLTQSRLSLGWYAIHLQLPAHGSLSIFPAQQDVHLQLHAGFDGVWRLNAHSTHAAQTLGEIVMDRSTARGGSYCRGELRLPGIKLIAPFGEWILADPQLRMQLQRQAKHTERQGDWSVEAQRAAWLWHGSAASEHALHALPPGFLIEQPMLTLRRDEETHLSLAWPSARGINLHAYNLPRPVELGQLNLHVAWRDIDGFLLLADGLPSKNKTPIVQRLNALTLALGRGYLRIDDLEMHNTQGRMHLSGSLSAHNPALDWHDLQMHLQADMDRAWLFGMLNALRQNASDETNQALLNAWQRDGWLSENDRAQLTATLSLWRGQGLLSSRQLNLSSLP